MDGLLRPPDAQKRVAKAMLIRLRAEQRLDEYEEFKAEIDRARTRDCYVKATWTGDADVDMMVEEPAGTLCSLRNPRTTSKG